MVGDEASVRNVSTHDIDAGSTDADRRILDMPLGRSSDIGEVKSADDLAAAEHLSGLQTQITALHRQNADLARELNALKTSTMWKVTGPLRRIGGMLPGSVRRLVAVGLRAGYWLLTPHKLPARLRIVRNIYVSGGVEALQRRTLGPDPAGSTPAASDPETMGGTYQHWVIANDTLDDDDRRLIADHIAAMTYRPLISVVVPAYNTAPAALRAMIASVQSQLYPNWELCICDDASPGRHVPDILAEIAKTDARVKWVRREQNGNISAASNTALELAKGEFVALLDHDDVLPDHALYEVIVELNQNPDLDLIYSDEDKIDEAGIRYGAYFKPDFSLDLLFGQNMISHLGVYRRDIIERVGRFRLGFEGSQDYDLTLRVVAQSSPERIRHIPAVLYHWRQERSGGSFSQSNLEQCVAAARQSIQERLDARVLSMTGGTVTACVSVPHHNRVAWDLPVPLPLVSIVIPTRDRVDLLRNCVSGLLYRTTYDAVEILIVDNGSTEPETAAYFADLAKEERVRILTIEGDFNYSRLNNEAVGQARGSVIVLMNNDIEIIEAGWLNEMVGLVCRKDVGAVGAKLLYGDGRVQHAGVRLGAGHFEGGTGVAGHFGLLKERYDVGYFGQLALTRDVSAVTGACLAVRRDIYQDVGGLDEDRLKVAFNDVDFCLRIREAGYKVVWTPFAELYHLESASRGLDETPEKQERFRREAQYMIDRWGAALQSDPYYNLNFENIANEYALSFPTRRSKPWHAFRRKKDQVSEEKLRKRL